MKAFKILGSIILNILFVAVAFAAGGVIEVFVLDKIETQDYQTAWNDKWVEDSVIISSDLSIHFIEPVNKYAGDCVYIKCGENDILIDAGSRKSSASAIIKYVDDFVDDNTLEYVIATHEDQDHIAGFVGLANGEGIFDHYQVETIIDFPLYTADVNDQTQVLKQYFQVRDAEVEVGAKHYTALECYKNQNGASRKYQLSETVEMEILYNYYYENTATDQNEYSVCMMLNEGNNHYLFTGDLEGEGERKLVKYYEDNHGGLPHCVLFKGGHHGSYSSTTPELMEAITPEMVCVCCCAGSDEYTSTKENQFPSQAFVNNVAPYTKRVYVTTVVDESSDSGYALMNGNIICYSKNGMIGVRCSNNATVLKDTDWFKENRTCPQAWA